MKKAAPKDRLFKQRLERVKRFELSTSTLARLRSTPELRPLGRRFGGPNCAYSSTASRVGLTPTQLAALAGTNGCQYWNPFSTAVPMNIT